MPARMACARRNDLNPSIGRIRRLIFRSSCSTRVVQILALPDGNRFLIGFAGVERGQRCGVGATFIDSDHFRFAVMANRLAKEA